MSLPQSKTYLPYKLSRLWLKFGSLFVQKLVLFREDEEETKSIRHYDYQCQGIAILKSFFKKRHQNILMKAMHEINQVGIDKKNNKNKEINNISLREAENQHKPIPSVTRRTFLNTTNTISESSPIRKMQQPTQESRYAKNHFQNAETDSNLQKLLLRVKKINQQNRSLYNFNTQNENDRDYVSYKQGSARNSLHFNGNDTFNKGSMKNYHYGEFQAPKEHRKRIVTQYDTIKSQRLYKDSMYYNSQMLSVKNSRRQYILEKFNQLEGNLQSLGFAELKQGKAYPRISQNIRNDLMTLKSKLQRRTLDDYHQY